MCGGCQSSSGKTSGVAGPGLTLGMWLRCSENQSYPLDQVRAGWHAGSRHPHITYRQPPSTHHIHILHPQHRPLWGYTIIAAA